jgi:hypothetical protein
MQEGPWDASAALVGSVLMVVLVAGLDLPTRLVEWPIILVITTVAVLSVKLGWRAPMAHDLAPVLERPVAVVRRVARPARTPQGSGDPGSTEQHEEQDERG